MKSNATMSRWWWAWVLAVAMTSAWVGCSDDGGQGGDDAGTDSDSDSDSDTDTDTDTGTFEFDAQRVYDDMIWLCDDLRGGRYPGEQGNEDALDYVEAVFEEIGLEPMGDDSTYRQHFTATITDVIGTPAVTLDSDSLAFGSDFQVFALSGSGTVSGEVVFVGHGMTVPPFDAADYPNCPLDQAGYDDFEGVDVTDKIALVLRHGPGDDEDIHNYCPANEACATTPCLWNFGYKANNAALNGAVGMILVNHYQTGPAVDAGGTIGNEYYDADFPSIFAHRTTIENAIPDLPSWSDTIDSTMQPDSHATGIDATIDVEVGAVDIETANLLGAVPGSDADLADEVVVIGAHIDHLGTQGDDIYNGCDDNASGTAVMTELARATAALAQPPARTVLFASWNAEEMGLIGSYYYVDNDPKYPLADTFACYSVDMVGKGGGIGLTVYGGQAYSGSWLCDVMAASAAEMELDYSVVPTDPLYASDHAPFAQVGIPGVLASTTGTHDNYHTPQDDIDNVTLEDVEAGMWTMWAGLLPLAMGTEDDYLTKYIPEMAPFDPRQQDAKHWLHRDK